MSPPSRILSVPKQGGAATVLLESADRTLLPVAADAERIIVFAAGNESSWNEVSLSDPQLVPLALQPPSNSEVSGNAFHWSEHGNLMRAGFDDTAAEFVTRLRSDDFALGPDYFLSRQIDSNSVEQAVVHTLFLQGVDSECARVVPKTAPIISGTVSDPGYIYFYNSRNWDWSSPEGPRAEGELVRVDVTSGALARLQSPELTPELDFDIVGSDAESLYIASGDRLLAVRKP